jgi:hypothetical protein
VQTQTGAEDLGKEQQKPLKTTDLRFSVTAAKTINDTRNHGVEVRLAQSVAIVSFFPVLESCLMLLAVISTK